ncbi:MAG: type II toxin-antitoxin system VapC family toxin [Chloroflexi bacterium]|nr:type II toxin-antitoxin system VapC family toxin [Chloroflexota bacterium]
MANYILDTGLVIRHLRGQRSSVKFFRNLGKIGRLSVSVVTRLEVHAGMHPDERYATQKLLSRFATIELDSDIADRAGDLIQLSQDRGKVLSVPDAIIATTAIANHLTLVTLNTRHFKHISGLSLEPITNK